MRYAYYPGCFLHGSSLDYEISVQALCRVLGIELLEIKNWTCCGATHTSTITNELAAGLSARNLIRGDGLEVTTPCNICYYNLKRANHLFRDPALKSKVNDALATKYEGNTKVKHLLEIIYSDYGLDALKEKVKKPLKGLKAAAYYGCLLTRPRDGFDSPEYPTSLDKVLMAIGIETVDYYYKTKCCGGPIFFQEDEAALSLSRELLIKAKEGGGDCIVTACPLCQVQLDARQPKIEKKYGEHLGIPVLYFTQILGLSLGIPPHQLGIPKLIVRPEKVLSFFRS